MKISKVSVIGFGAVGALYGDKISSVVDSFEVIVNGERKERYQRNGIIINGVKKSYNFVDSKNASKPQLLIIATKNNHLNQVINDIKHIVDENTIILSLLNGIVSERILETEFPKSTILYSFAVGLSSENLVQQINYSTEGKIVFGSKNNELTDEVLAVESLLKLAKVDYLIPKNILHDLWNKFMMNTCYNTISSILRGGYGIFKSEDVKNLLYKVAKEVQLVALKEDIIITDEDIDSNQALIVTLDIYGKTSMCQDIEASRTTENKYFSKTVIDLAQKHGLTVPYCESIYYLAQGAEYKNEMMKQKVN
ncbi:MAG: ketopantoate reductase family protein [Pleomorphochaeta sp.]